MVASSCVFTIFHAVRRMSANNLVDQCCNFPIVAMSMNRILQCDSNRVGQGSAKIFALLPSCPFGLRPSTGDHPRPDTRHRAQVLGHVERDLSLLLYNKPCAIFGKQIRICFAIFLKFLHYLASCARFWACSDVFGCIWFRSCGKVLEELKINFRVKCCSRYAYSEVHVQKDLSLFLMPRRKLRLTQR